MGARIGAYGLCLGQVQFLPGIDYCVFQLVYLFHFIHIFAYIDITSMLLCNSPKGVSGITVTVSCFISTFPAAAPTALMSRIVVVRKRKIKNLFLLISRYFLFIISPLNKRSVIIVPNVCSIVKHFPNVCLTFF